MAATTYRRVCRVRAVPCRSLMGGSPQDSGELRPRVLGTAGALGQSLAIGPIVSVALIAFLIAGAAGANAPLVVLIALAGSLALGWTIPLYARRFAGAGAVYEYLAGAHGPRAG